jgi:hypothetical protein
MPDRKKWILNEKGIERATSETCANESERERGQDRVLDIR